MQTLVVIPTYNEKDNIYSIIESIFKECPNVHILVVDDQSPDGTGQIVSELSKSNPQVHLLPRAKKEGLGRAYLAGFEWALERKYECIVEMDADFSHRPVDLKAILEAAKTSDFVVGSRYVLGGQTVNWGLLRKVISLGGSLYSRLILGYPLRDWTGGFNAWKSATLNKMNLSDVKSNGYSFQIELKYRALKSGHSGIEVPIIFEDRRVGQSKMSLGIVLEALYKVWWIRWGIRLSA